MPQQATIEKAQSRAAAFRNRNRIPLTLPSGIEIMARKVTLVDLFTAKQLPDSVSAVVAQMIAESSARAGKPAQSDQAGARIQAALTSDTANMLGTIDATVKMAFVEPRIVATVTDPDNEILLDDVDFADRQFVFAWCQGGEQATAAAAFRPEPDGTLSA